MKKIWFITALLFLGTGVWAQVDEETDDSDEIEIEAIEEDFENLSDTTEIDLGDIEEDELSAERRFPWNRFTVGGSLGQFSFGQITNIGVNPEITFKASPLLRFGVGGTYEYFRQRELVYRDIFSGQLREIPEFSNTNYGGRTYARITPFKAIFAQVEYEKLERDTPYAQTNQGQILNYEESLDNVNVGLGFAQAGTQNGGPYLLLMYNLMHGQNEDDFDDRTAAESSNVDYPFDAISFRGGLDVPLGMGDKNKKKNKKRKPAEFKK